MKLCHKKWIIGFLQNWIHEIYSFLLFRCNPYFVRCIKPNNHKAPMVFETKVVLDQLRYTGMLETIRIRKMGYPVRIKFPMFISRYAVLISKCVFIQSWDFLWVTVDIMSFVYHKRDLCVLIELNFEFSRFHWVCHTLIMLPVENVYWVEFCYAL